LTRLWVPAQQPRLTDPDSPSTVAESFPTPSPVRIEIVDNLGGVPASQWDRLLDGRHPFLTHAFLRGLETQRCVGEHYGWVPQHLLAWERDTLLGAAPLYLKLNSYGEFVFDWSWAEAYRRSGLPYYPKLVGASPYTPATGPKLLASLAADAATVRETLAGAALALADRLGVSSLHWLFSPDEEAAWLTARGLLRRVGCQFHWSRDGCADFEGFLETLTAEKRKKIRRERRRVLEAGIRFRLLDGHSASEGDWDVFHEMYVDTFERRGGTPTLSAGFFRHLAEAAPKSVLLVLAVDGPRPVAAAFCLVGSDCLYGRHWGCRETYHSLHFETCYYQGLEFCLERGLDRFEPGAQGEHKVSRGFLPTRTWSTHWIADDRFRRSIARFLDLEAAAMADYCAEMSTHSPYRRTDDSTGAA
jgi:hypothetical protein